jgi:hypothetical protein
MSIAVAVMLYTAPAQTAASATPATIERAQVRDGTSGQVREALAGCHWFGNSATHRCLDPCLQTTWRIAIAQTTPIVEMTENAVTFPTHPNRHPA